MPLRGISCCDGSGCDYVGGDCDWDEDCNWDDGCDWDDDCDNDDDCDHDSGCDYENFCLELIDGSLAGVIVEIFLAIYAFVGIAAVADGELRERRPAAPL